MRGAISLTVFRKGFLASDPTEERYNDYITIKCAYQNTSTRDIRAFRGVLRFTDLFDRLIFESGLTISDPIAAGAKMQRDGIEIEVRKARRRRLIEAIVRRAS